MNGCPDPYKIRPVKDGDAHQLIDLINTCFQEYEHEGVFIDLEDLDADLKAMRTKIDGENGDFWVVFDGDQLIASIGIAPVGVDMCELKRLYMLAEYRGQGLADYLTGLVEQWALDHGHHKMTLWSDTRFTRAHSFYQRHGYIQQPKTRDLGDISNTTEFQFTKAL